ncbi:MAG: DEAD/DEAH box helicase family protein, partial [Victivallales bacterium]|nr:DEAD/DEAH box helicase family protein [Victivallales bacterium]
MSKKDMTEEDIKLQFITPAITKAKWSLSDITMETQVKFTDGKISLQGNCPHRENPKKADYLLYMSPWNPIAVVEAKDNSHLPSYGLQQAKEYAQMLDVPFAYSSNGDSFVEFDFLTGVERNIPMDAFPTKEELVARYKAGANGGNGLSEAEIKASEQPYYTSDKTWPPRYYQRVAVNRTIAAIARGEQRLLLAMATGTGKTYTAFQIVYRLLKSGTKKKVLYLADRNFLVDTSIQQDFAPLEKSIYKVNYATADPATITSHEVYFALYQQLAGENEDEPHYKELFAPDFFDLVIVDECHRGSAKADSTWRTILEYFSPATQIGMTATPKETKYISNIDYFGKPLYTYSLRDGIDDGFLAPFRVINVKTNIGDGWRPYLGQKDIFENVIEDRIYNNTDYDYNIILQDRHREVAREITEYLKHTDRMAKTIVFCATEEHAEYMRQQLCQMNADLCKEYPDYCVRITGSDVYGKSKLSYFLSVGSKIPVIATTSQLLTTGADCKMTKLIVIDKEISSLIEFKQIIGRGTRIREQDGKTHFTVMDFRNVSRLFADPNWDGPIEQDPGWPPKGDDGGKPPSPPQPPPVPPLPPDPPPPEPPQQKPVVDVNGCPVKVIGKVVAIYDTNGKLLRQEDIIDYTKTNIRGEFAHLHVFIERWNSEGKKENIMLLLRQHGIDL